MGTVSNNRSRFDTSLSGLNYVADTLRNSFITFQKRGVEIDDAAVEEIKEKAEELVKSCQSIIDVYNANSSTIKKDYKWEA